MSTTFQIIPTETTFITFGQVITASERNINAFLHSIGIDASIQLQINLHDNQEKYVQEIPSSALFTWAENEYAWFTVNGIAGGTDAYCSPLNDPLMASENPWWWLDEIKLSNRSIPDLDEKLEKAKAFNRVWSFRRSAGQPGIIALGYGLMAAAVAELTQGIIWSEDNAWDYDRFPAEYADFLTWYFRPEKALSPEHAHWARGCLARIPGELGAKTYLP